MQTAIQFALIVTLALGALYVLDKTKFGSDLFFTLKGSTPSS